MKQFNLFHNLSDGARRGSTLGLCLVSLICLTIGVGQVWGAEVTGTINFGNGSGDVNINGASVSGDDSRENTWRVTTVGTTSYTPNASYAQIGSGDKPATSITFAVKLPSVQTFSKSKFSARFGGFSSTAGTVTLKVTNTSTSTTTTVATGSLSGTSDVTVTNSSTAASGDSLTVTITSIKKGVKCYWISYTYTPVVYTVAWDANGNDWSSHGSPSTSAEGGGRVSDLPTAPTAAACDDSKVFRGWTATPIVGTQNTAPADLFTTAAGAPIVSGNVTYYAVFATGESVSKTLSLDITPDDFNSSSYADNNNEKTTTATATDASGVTMDVNWTSYQVMLSSTSMQWQKSKGYIYNSTDLGTINSVTVTSSAGSFTTYYGTTSQPSSGSSGSGKGYFKTSVGGATGTTSNVNVNFTTSVTVYSAYATSCCSALDDINGTVSWTNAATAVVSWDNIANVSSWTVKYKTHSAGGWSTWAGDQTVYTKSTTNDSRKVTITGLTHCTDYDFQIIATPASGYCNKSETIEDDQTHVFTYTVTKTNVSLKGGEDEEANACEDFEAVYVANSGYLLPGSITVTNAGEEGTGWMYDDSDGSILVDKTYVTGNVTITITGAAASGWKFKYSGDSWEEHTMNESAGVASYSISLAADSRFEFGIDDNGAAFYKNNGTIITTTSGWVFNTSDDNCKIHTGPAGTYTFAINTSTKAVTVTYPSVTHPNAHYVYFKNTNVWGTVYGYLANSGNDNKAAAWPGSVMSATTTICGETYHYAALNAMSGTYNTIIFNNGNSGYGNQTSDLSTTGSLGKYNANQDAAWHQFKYTISYAAGTGGSGSMSSHADLCPGSNQALSANAFTKDHYHFTGWVANVDVTINSATVTAGTLITGTPTIQNIQSDITLTAQWEINSNTLTWNWGGGSTTSTSYTLYPATSGSVNYGADITKPANNTMSQTGYNFNGWSSSATTMPDNDLTITAQWTVKTTTVSFNQNGGDGGQTSSKTATYGTAMPTPITTPTKAGYIFDGYYENSGGTGTKYYNANGTSATNWDKEDATWTLYAKWIEKGCTDHYGTNVVSGTTSTTSYQYGPVDSYYEYSTREILYTKTDLGLAAGKKGTIKSIYFEYYYGTALTSKTNVKIYMANTNLTALSNSKYVTSFTEVYSGSLNCSNGWNEIILNTPFEYDGIGNLVVIIDDNSNAYDGTSYVFKYHTASPAPTYAQLYTRSASTNADPTAAATWTGATQTNYRPNTKFCIEESNMPTYTVNWYVNGSVEHSQTSYQGAALTDVPTPTSSDCDGEKVFVGWSTSEIDGTTNVQPADLFTDASRRSVPIGGVDYYAVFATSTGSESTSYAAITSGLSSGNYVIAYEYNNNGTRIALQNVADGGSPTTQMEGYALARSDGKYANPAATYIWQLQAQNDGTYYIYDLASGLYLSATTSSLQLSSTGTKYDIAYDGTNSRWTIKLHDSNTYYVHGYVSGSAYDFRVSTGASDGKYRTYLYKNEGSQVFSDYATSCGAALNGTDGLWVTSTKDQYVKVVVPVTANKYENNSTLNVSLSSASTAAGFSIVSGNGAAISTGDNNINVVLCYKPTAYNTTADAELTLSDANSYAHSKVLTIHGRSLSDKFVIAVKVGENWVALPANMNGSNTYEGISITTDNAANPTCETSGASTAIYRLLNVYKTGGSGDRYADYGTRVRFLGNTKCLVTNTAVGGTGINNGAQPDNAKTDPYEWTLSTTDGVNYTINPNAAQKVSEERALRYYTSQNKFGMYLSSGSLSTFRLLPVQCATPVLSPEGGTYDATQNVAITCGTAGASIYYTMTTDGSTPADPTSSSTAYTSPISVTVNGTKIKAIAIKDGMNNSAIASATYTFKVTTPTFSVPGGSYNQVQSISLSCSTTGAVIYYTTNGDDPTASSTRYTGSPIVLSTPSTTTTIKAIAIKTGMDDSEVASATYTLGSYKYKATFITGGSGSNANPPVADVWAEYDEDDGEYVLRFPYGPIPTCSGAGWEFAGWSDSDVDEQVDDAPAGMYLAGDGYVVEENHTCYAVYRKLRDGETSITFNANSTTGLTVRNDTKWWVHDASGCEVYIWDGARTSSTYYRVYNSSNSLPDKLEVDVYRPFKEIEFTLYNSNYKIDSISVDDGTATLTTSGSTQKVTGDGVATKLYIYPAKTGSYKEIQISKIKITYQNYHFISSPDCKPIQAEAPEKLTSTSGERVYSDEYTIECRDLKENGTLSYSITGTNAAMFGCEIANTSIGADGSLTTTYRVYYEPTAAGATHTATLVFKDNSGTPITGDELALSGRSLPAKFAIVAYNSSTSKYYALDGSMSGEATTPKGLEVTISAGAVASCPSRAVYSLTDRDPQSQYVHLVSGSRKLYGSGVNGVTTSTVASDNTGWLLSSDNLTDYHITNEAVNNRGLMLYNGEFGNYAVSQYGVSGYYGDLKIYPITAECTCLEVEDVTIVAKQTTATLTWPAVEGAASYTVTCSGGSVGAVTGTETMTCAITGLTKNTAYTFTVKPNAASSDCSLTTNGGFTTTECDDVPSLGATQCKTDNATISWTCEAATATVRVYSDEACSSQVGDDYTSKTSPFKISSLVPNTTYYYKVWAGGTCPSSVGSFTTEEVHLDVTEWSNNSVTIIYNGDASATLTTFSETAHGDASSNVADSLFISKYFEADGDNKMIAIFNGTKDTINLNNYKLVRSAKGGSGVTYYDLELKNFGRKKTGYIAPNEEIIIMRYTQNDNSADTCSRKEDNYEDWYIIESGTMDGSGNNIYNWLQFAGPMSIGLYSKTANKYIDIIGASTKADGTGSLVQINSSNNTPCSDAIDGTYNDGGGFNATNGDNVKTDEEEDNYFLSTNRCLLIRKNSVKSGMNAVKKNLYSKTLDCSDTIAAAMTTLAEEWRGYQIGKGNDTEAKTHTCEGLGYVGGYDYNDYYVSMDTIKQEKTFEDMKSDPFDGTYVIPVEGLDTMACTNIRIELKDGSDNVIVTKDFQVPIMVSGTKTTTNAIFSSYGKTPATCKTCDVVIMNTATLTREVNGTPSADISQVGNVEVYRGGKLVIPTGTSFTVNSLSLRRDEDTVSSVSLQGTGSLTIGSTKGVSLELRIDPSNWHYVSLPYDCDIDDITFGDGGPAIYGTDYYIREYDGEYRAANKKSRWNHLPAHGTLKKGKGYIIGIAGDGIVKKELRFPMANAVITEEKSNKTIDKLYAWGGNDDDLTPNHKGWNMVGAPFLSGYGYWADGSGNEAEFLPTGKLVADGSGNYEYDGTSVKYIVYPIGNGWGGYGQKAIGECPMDPFTAYFIQIGGDDPSEERSITFQTGKRASIVQRRAADYDLEDKHPIWVGVELQNAKGESDATTLLISDQFTDGYDMTNDLVKVRGTYYNYPSVTTKPVLASRNNEGEMAFNALPDETAAVEGVPLNYYAAQAGMYTFALNERYSLEEVESVLLYDATTAKYYDLMSKDYSFSTDRGDNKTRFTLFVRVERKQPEITTDNNDDNILTDGELSLVAVERTLVLSGLSSDAYIYVYDMSGKLLTGERAKGDHGVWRTTVPTAGVYFVRVNSTAGQQTLRTIVK